MVKIMIRLGILKSRSMGQRSGTMQTAKNTYARLISSPPFVIQVIWPGSLEGHCRCCRGTINALQTLVTGRGRLRAS